MNPKITTKLIYDEVKSRGWRGEIIEPTRGIYRFFDGSGNVHYLRSTISEKTSVMNSALTRNKALTNKLADELGIKTPDTLVYTNLGEALKFLEKHKTIVVKPLDASHGDGVTINVVSKADLTRAVNLAKENSDTNNILLQEFVPGSDYRLLFIGGKFVAAAVREPASVVGDGISIINELINKENKNLQRGEKYSTKLNIISLVAAQRYLGDKMGDIPAKGEKVQVVGTANMGVGGCSVDVTNTINPEIVKDAARMLDSIQMEFGGIDFIYDPTHPNNRPVFIEINVAPSFHLHEYPSKGEGVRVTKMFIDWLSEAKK